MWQGYCNHTIHTSMASLCLDSSSHCLPFIIPKQFTIARSMQNTIHIYIQKLADSNYNTKFVDYLSYLNIHIEVYMSHRKQVQGLILSPILDIFFK